MKSSSVHQLHDDIAVVGWACRLPGANSVADLWSLLIEERCAISRVPDDRFSLAQFGHPRRQERGKSYSWAAGILDDIWGFDPSVFGISPREAVQLDPQQRILLQLTWEALEDAGLPPSSVANQEVGVFVGASQTDYGHAFFTDPAVADAHFGPGTALAILANRISYVYGLHGPSITVDTACSSSLVALHQAMQALRSGRIDTAIVAGSNLIASPASFIAFSQANMLSSTGLCQAFSAGADGFVRAEGAVVFVLRRAALALARQNPIHGRVIHSDVNSDGRTNGIALPNADAQEALLSRVYEQPGLDVDRLAFVEAHGTGTPVGDPVEAAAIGRCIGQKRARRLPIGSIKTNIGHLEPASGLAGVLKALLALNHGLLPRSLHFDEPNPHIPFDDLNVSVCTQPLLLPEAGEQYAGVNSFGFGGTNAHAVVAAGQPAPAPVVDQKDRASVFAFSANSTASLQALARAYSDEIDNRPDEDTAVMAGAIVHRREWQSNRLVVSSTRSDVVKKALDEFLAGGKAPGLTVGSAVGRDLPVALVFSGNGGQRVGMGVAAYRENAVFRERFEEVDAYFKEIGGWSLKEALFSETLGERLPMTSVAQPLIFAIQSASTAALRAAGLRPSAVLGHSVGEVAAAEAAGALDLRTAVKVIHCRSEYQEQVRGAGRMAAVLASAEGASELIDELDGVELAAINSSRAVTVAGPADALSTFKRLAKERGVAVLDLGLDYPFHTALMDSVEEPLREALREIRASDAPTPFISTVTGACIPGSRLDGDYWWRNVREPVRFVAAIRAAAELGARYFIEVGPRATLLQHITETLRGEVNGSATYAPLGRSEEEGDPFAQARAHAIVTGARLEVDKVFGPDPGPGVSLPHYPWQQSPFRFKPTPEAIGGDPGEVPHPFAGVRSREDALDWRAHVDAALYPRLSDHKLGEKTIFPGTAFLEIALTVARRWLESDAVALARFEILNPLDLTDEGSHEILTRVSPGSSTLEIFSRPRLSQAGWVLHCRSKMHRVDGDGSPRGRQGPDGGRVVDSSTLYGIADASGLHYGPAFRLVRSVTVRDGRLIRVELVPHEEKTPFALDPMRLDASAHGFFTLFPGLRAEERGMTYIPVQMEEVSLYRPYVPIARAFIEITSASDTAIVGNAFVYGRDDELIAALRGVRSQAVPMRRVGSVDTAAFVEDLRPADGTMLGKTGIEVGVNDLVRAANDLKLVADASSGPSDTEMLVEGCAAAVVYEVATAVSEGGTVDVESLVESGRIPEELRPWILNGLHSLRDAGLASQDGGSWQLTADASLPSSASVVNAIAEEHPSRAGEILSAAAMAGVVGTLSEGGSIESLDAVLPKVTLDFYAATSVAVREASDTLHDLLVRCDGLWPEDRALRILQVGYSPLAQTLLASGRVLHLTVFEPDARRYGSAELALSRNRDVTLVDVEGAQGLGSYDLIIGVEGLHRLPPTVHLADLQAALAPGGVLVAVEPDASLFKDLTFGVDRSWFLSGSGGPGGRPRSRLRSAGRWGAEMAEAGFEGSRALTIRSGSEHAVLLVAESGSDDDVREEAADEAPQDTPPDQKRAVVMTSAGNEALGEALSGAMDAAGLLASRVGDDEEFPTLDPSVVVHMGAPDRDLGDPVEALTRRCLDIKACAERLGDTSTTLWLVFAGAISVQSSAVHPVETGAWAFSRTLANEFPKLDVRRIDIAPGLSGELAADRMARIIGSGTDETELRVDERVVSAVRVTAFSEATRESTSSRKAGAGLVRRSASGQRLAWEPRERRRPGAGEVEVQVEATGLNFRDVMWSMSLLPEDMLEDGFSGPTLGLECAGKVVRVGPDVEDLSVGDRVMAFAGSSFSTHVTVEHDQAVKLPETLSCEAAATVPVAFFTAYYSLVTQARLRRGEWVLIHGGAGAVGMAAVQIALTRRAKVIATAGSPAKRNLLRALGVAHVLDSRSLRFADDVREITGDGVDVVLNSLAGEAMERSIACLRPFGRFVELGKRDYVADTHVGLRPFRRNLTYFGVDVDQVIGARKALGERVFAQILRQFEKGRYVPLPHSVFNGENVSAAFHLMQQSGHIGKLVVRPPARIPAAGSRRAFRVDAEGTHVITGAFGGFGMETAKWLVEKGARHLVLIGRRGPATEEAQEALRDFAARGVKTLAEPCDVTDRRALGRLFETIHATMPPVVGVIHAAMVLDDGILANLDADRFRRVLAPKITGAENLDELVRGEKLDYFILYSSVTTLIGNPGQANYVAANAYMEGLARRRREKGLPALAVGWGPILDVGVVAQNEALMGGLQKLTGVTGMRAREALTLMEQALERLGTRTAVVTISPSDGAFSGDRLAVLRSPTYEAFVSSDRTGGADGATIDLHALAAKEGVEAARRKVADVISAQLARVLQLREEDISQVRPLGEIGLDSLMALELVMNLEESFGIHVPLGGASGGMTVSSIADQIIAHVGLEREGDGGGTAATSMVEQHQHDVDPGQVAALKEALDDTGPAPKRLLS